MVAPARPLSEAFSAGAGAPQNRADLETVLAATWSRAAAEWPGVGLDPARYAHFLGARVPEAELENARAADLFIACACASGDGRALAALEGRQFREIDGSLVKMNLGPARIDEVKQRLRHDLFASGRIGDYRGAGDLKAWLRVSAMRSALKLIRSENREISSSDDAVLEQRSSSDSPELSYMKAAYRAAFSAAFQEALDTLLPKERTLLKQQIVDGLSVDDLGTLYQVHRATAARWVQSAREKLLMRTRRTFMINAKLSSEECESIMRMVRSQLDVSLHRRLVAT